MESPRIALICVGSELLRGKINSHASTIARRLASIGLELTSEQTVGDSLHDLTRAIRNAIRVNAVTIITGGLGPTFDDLTREAAASACEKRLKLSPVLLRGIKEKFRRARLKKMPPANTRQAFLLEGAHAISNSVGTAPGQWLLLASAPYPSLLILLPGPPSEMEPMLESFVLPHLRKTFTSGAHAEAHLHFVGVPESVIDQQVRPIIHREKNVDFTILARPGLVDLDIFVRAPMHRQAKAKLESVVRAIRNKTGSSFYGRDVDYPLAKVIRDRFKAKKATLAVAESCTGGFLAKRLTDIAGSSKYFVEGRVTYANAAKVRELGVSENSLKQYGAVSRQVASEMARGIKERASTSYGLSVTGIAGPDGGSVNKPVGLVFIALASKGRVQGREFRFKGNRMMIRQRAVLAAMDLLRHIEK